MLYLVYAESYHYCGYGQHFVVEALSEEHATELCETAIDEYFYEQDGSQLEEEGIEDGPYGNVLTVEPFDSTHESWQYYQDPSQSEFYIEVSA